MSTTLDSRQLSRSGVFEKLSSLLSEVSSTNSSDRPLSSQTDSTMWIEFETPFAHLTYRSDLLSLEHVHFRCRSVSSFDPTRHTSLCEAVLGIFPDTCLSKESPVIVRGVVERWHRRIKVGDWLIALNGTRVTWTNLHDLLSKYQTRKKLRLTVRHPIYYNSTFSSSLQPPISLPIIEEKKVIMTDPIDCIHAVLYYEKRVDQGFKLLYQQPRQKDIFFAAGGIFPTLTQLMRDINEHDNLLRSVSIKLSEQIVHACVGSDDSEHYLVIVYPPMKNLHVILLEQHTKHLIRLIRFLFGSIASGIRSFSESIDYFFQIFFYRLSHLTSDSSATLKSIRLIDEFFPAQFNSFGVCPKLIISDQTIQIHIDTLLNQLECQNLNECSTEHEIISNRYRRIFFVRGSVLFHQQHLVLDHLSSDLTTDIYRYLLHYGHLNLTQISNDTWQLLLFKQIFPQGLEARKRSFLYVSCQNTLTLAVLVDLEHDTRDIQIAPDHTLIQQMKLILSDISAIFPSNIHQTSPWPIASPIPFVRNQLKRTLSLPMIGSGRRRVAVPSKDADVEEVLSLGSLNFPDPSLPDLRASQLISQPESQDELYKNNRQSMISSTLSLDEQSQNQIANQSIQSAHQNHLFANYRLHPGAQSTIFYYLDFQSIRSILIAPYFTLDRLTQNTLIERQLFETIQQTCVYLRRKHFAPYQQRKTLSSSKNLFSNKARPRYDEIACQFSISTDTEKSTKKKKDGHYFHFWIVGKKCFQPIEHEFFVCYHDSIAQNINELAFTIGLSSAV